MENDEKPKAMGQVIQIDEARIKDHLGEMVRGTVEEALNATLAPTNAPKGAATPVLEAMSARWTPKAGR